MPYDPAIHTGRLHRLAPPFYSGPAYIHWTMTTHGRRTGWLNDAHHFQVREILCHFLGKYDLLCPTYCLMPDHAHFLWIGWSPSSDQRRAITAFRTEWGRLLKGQGYSLDRQAFDHVLNEKERDRGALAAICHYILRNPERARLVNKWDGYPHMGALVPGYPGLDPRVADYWLRFWRIHNWGMVPNRNESLAASAT